MLKIKTESNNGKKISDQKSIKLKSPYLNENYRNSKSISSLEVHPNGIY